MHRFLFFRFLFSFFKARHQLVWENAFLRYQLRLLRQKQKRVIVTPQERGVLLWFCRRFAKWRDFLVVVQPETLIQWHRQGFRLFWSWKSSGGKRGRPLISPRTIELIQKISKENFLWGSPRIQGELLKLGFRVSKSTVEKYMVKGRKPSTPSWKTFLRNHTKDVVAVDFLTVPTLTFRLLYVLIVLSLDRRKILHYAVTPMVSEAWTTQQIREAFPFQDPPRYVIHDRDRNFSGIGRLGFKEIVTAARSPWQNGYVERVIGSIKRECLNHVIILGRRHLHGVLASYCRYYNESRTHLSLENDSPFSRPVEAHGTVTVRSEVGGLHHRYGRSAA